jgi:hypothetical protein
MWCALHVHLWDVFATEQSLNFAESIPCEKSFLLWNWFLEASMPCEGIEDFRIVIIFLYVVLGRRRPHWSTHCQHANNMASGGQNDDFRQICDILRPQIDMNRFLPLWPHRFPRFGHIHLGGGGGGGGGSDIRSMSSIRPICKCRCPSLNMAAVGRRCKVNSCFKN